MQIPAYVRTMLKTYVRYFFGVLAAIPLLPIMIMQGKRIKATIPQLPEASGPQGLVRSKDANEQLKLLVVGESTIAGVGVRTHEEGFSGTLANELSQLFSKHIEWQVYAKSGYTARKVREKLIPEIEITNPDLIVIGLGGNDSFTLNTPWGWKKEVTLLIKEMRKKFPDAEIMFISMPPIKEFAAFTSVIKWVVGNLAEILGETLQSVVRGKSKVSYYHQVISLQKWMQQFEIEASYGDFFSDGVHPSKLTYQVMARDMALFIHEELT